MTYDTESRRAMKARAFIDFAYSIGKLTTCKRAEVGVVVCDKRFTSILALGYNGQPAGAPNDCCTGEEGECGCVHAEINALVKLGAVSDCVMICTCAPCWRCAGAIINSRKIGLVVWMRPYRDDKGLRSLESCGIQHERI